MKNIYFILIKAVFLIALLPSNLYSQTGTVDPTFDPGTGTGFTGNADIICIALQSDGKILIGGYFNTYNGIAVNNFLRLNTDGSRDNTFNVGTGADNSVHAISIQNDGKIIIAGSFAEYNDIPSRTISRINTDGTLDTTFDAGMGAYGNVRSISIQNDGKIIVGGEFGNFDYHYNRGLVRLNTDGSFDSTFDSNPGFDGNVYSTKIQSDGKIIVGGGFYTYDSITRKCIARINIDGSLDTSFNPGTGFDLPVWTVEIQNNGQILAGGEFSTYNNSNALLIVRLNTDGTQDGTFNNQMNNGSAVRKIIEMDNGKLFMCGNIDYNMNYLNNDGSLDSSLMGNNLSHFPISSVIQNDGRIILVGTFISPKNHIVRINGLSVAIEENSRLESSIEIFQNPCLKDFTVKLSDDFKNSHLEVFNLIGESVIQKKISKQYEQFHLDNTGVYIIRINSRNKYITKKFLIQE